MCFMLVIWDLGRSLILLMQKMRNLNMMRKIWSWRIMHKPKIKHLFTTSVVSNLVSKFYIVIVLIISYGSLIWFWWNDSFQYYIIFVLSVYSLFHKARYICSNLPQYLRILKLSPDALTYLFDEKLPYLVEIMRNAVLYCATSRLRDSKRVLKGDIDFELLNGKLISELINQHVVGPNDNKFELLK